MYVLGKVLAVSGVLAFGRSSLVYHAFEHFFVVFVAVQLIEVGVVFQGFLSRSSQNLSSIDRDQSRSHYFQLKLVWVTF